MAGKLHLPYEYGLSVEDNHRVACEALRAKLKWQDHPPMVNGTYGHDEYWVFMPRDYAVAQAPTDVDKDHFTPPRQAG